MCERDGQRNGQREQVLGEPEAATSQRSIMHGLELGLAQILPDHAAAPASSLGDFTSLPLCSSILLLLLTPVRLLVRIDERQSWMRELGRD